MKRGRPKGRSQDMRSFGPLGDLIRKHRLEKRLGLLDVAKACKCSVQFISNIEHGRAPLPWDKVDQLASYLKMPVEDLRAANLAIRSDFRSFVDNTSAIKVRKVRTVSTPAVLRGAAGTASALAFSAHDTQLRQIIERYQEASTESRKKFVKAALRLLS